MKKTTWQAADGQDRLIEALQAAFKDYTLDTKQIPSTEQSIGKTVITFKLLNNEWQVDNDFFSEDETFELLATGVTLDALDKGWILRIKDKAASLAGTGALQLMSGISKISKPFMTIQRYKGLGEMNPEQLWETAMDPEKRSLTQVTIGDALEADTWFGILMGDDVRGRREFIEENGRFVKNLDV